MPGLLQLPRHVLLCRCSSLSGEMAHRAMYVDPLPNRLAACFADAWFPAGLSGFAVFISVAGIVYSLFLLLVPVIYEKYDKFNRLARALKEVRVGFILVGTGVAVSFLIS